jgi:hypothetical protein
MANCYVCGCYLPPRGEQYRRVVYTGHQFGVYSLFRRSGPAFSANMRQGPRTVCRNCAIQIDSQEWSGIKSLLSCAAVVSAAIGIVSIVVLGLLFLFGGSPSSSQKTQSRQTAIQGESSGKSAQQHNALREPSHDPAAAPTATADLKAVPPHDKFGGKKAPNEDQATAEKHERSAASALRIAKQFLKEGRRTTAQKWLEQLVDEHPHTSAAEEARSLLQGL